MTTYTITLTAKERNTLLIALAQFETDRHRLAKIGNLHLVGIDATDGDRAAADLAGCYPPEHFTAQAGTANTLSSRLLTLAPTER